MRINYANNPLIGYGKWDALLSLLTPDGDGIVIPSNLINPIRFRTMQLRKHGIAIFRVSTIDRLLPKCSDYSVAEAAINLEHALKEGVLIA